MSEVAALLALAATLAAAVARPRRAPDWAVAAVAARRARRHRRPERRRRRATPLADLGPTVAFLAALLVLADGCRAAGLFEALGAMMARGRAGDPRRLLAMVFVVAGATTAVLSLDATVVLLTPVVFATAARLRAPRAPARLRLLASGQQRVAAAARLEPHEPAGVRGERAVVRCASPR